MKTTGLTDEDRSIINAVRLAFEGEALTNGEARILAGALIAALGEAYGLATVALKLEVENGGMGFTEWDEAVETIVAVGMLLSAMKEAQGVRKD